MTPTTPEQTREPESTDPTRFARRVAATQAAPQRSIGETVGAAVAVLAIVVGVPVVLIALAGPPPIPTGVPSVRDAVRQLSFEDLVGVLVAVVWLAWLYFVVCLAVELVATLRGGIARKLPLAGPMQRLARALIGALLLTGVVAGPAQAVSASPSVAPAAPSIVATTLSDAQETIAQVDEAERQAEAAQLADTEVPAGELQGRKVYTVQPPNNGYYDNLWDIAERHLGDGRRYHEIYELNKDRVQPDHGRLELARLIQPGWQLVMPDDAVAVPVVSAEAPATPAPVPTDANVGVDSEAAADAVEGRDVAGVGLLAAGVLGALLVRRRRALGRRPDDDALDAEATLLIKASPERSEHLARALRLLAQQCREQRTALPSVYAASVDDDAVELWLSPPSNEVVPTWESVDDGARWRMNIADVGDVESDGSAVPYPALVSLGVDPDGRDVLLDVEAAGGVIAITGDSVQARHAATAIAVQAATSPWSEAVSVTAAGVPADLEQIAPERLHVTRDVSAELHSVRARIDEWRGDVLTGRLRRRGSGSRLLVCADGVDETQAEALRDVVGPQRQAFSVVVAGEVRGARWQLSIDEHGALRAPLLDLTVDANRVTDGEVTALLELFDAAASSTEDTTGDAELGFLAPSRLQSDLDWSTAQRRVGVLGPIGLRGVEAIDAQRIDQVTEIVVHLALHPDGVHPHALAAAVWPRGVPADVRDAAIERAREVLGADHDGAYFLREGDDGRLTLAPGVLVDWDVFRSLVAQARQSGGREKEIDLLRRALALVRGEPFAEAPAGRYAWVAYEDLRRQMAVLVARTAVRLCALVDGDPETTSFAASAGLRAVPGHQGLWRELLRASYAAEGVAGVRRTTDQMAEALRAVPIEAETEALLDELVPSEQSLPESG
ncbi:hypothetical protein D9V41_03650 [Aeromicrobium phragmitis]|uniref:Bacterial transcriptional activator domain-containing protein n=1 Tax=Aeromicrobium phragmitis TaxID=2478914 RepID=A0A3L8PN92_9ACTN|nr:hypothetical protein [Aeromicrobium phragmitis]RLV56877.1 hypothetical protein D9V41_03650 [Aeromicrobium phragmitis]